MRLKVARHLFLGAAIAAAAFHAEVARAQLPLAQPAEAWDCSAISRDVGNGLWNAGERGDSNAWSASSPRIRMFHMLPGFLSEPPGLNLDDSSDTGGDANMQGFSLSFGDDNPYFDPRRPGDPGGIGFLRIYSQMQILDWGNTSVCLGLQAWTPAGWECGGVQDGPTVMSPGLGIFHDLGAGAGLHGYVGQNFHGKNHQGPLRCGLAWHCPLNPWDEPADQSVYFFVQGMAKYQYASERQGSPMNWDVFPGIHWRLSDTFWMSVGGTRSSMVTWWWQF